VPAGAVTLSRESVSTRDGRRDYRLAVPETGAASRLPLVLLLHGHGGSAANAFGEGLRPSPLAAWLAIADREHVLIAALQGLKGDDGQAGWNDCRDDATGQPPTDDVAFVRAVIEQLAARRLVDPWRVYAMGMSNGAVMAFRLALELDPPLAGFCAASGSMASSSHCTAPRHPVAAMIIGGTADPLVPYGGGQIHLGMQRRGGVTSVAAAAEFWVRTDGIAGPPQVQRLPHVGGAADRTSAWRSIWGAPDTALQVELIRIDGGGHVEPSLAFHYGALYSLVVGAQNQDFESAEEAWRFFRGKRAQDGPARR